MMGGKLFEPAKWEVEPGAPRSKLLYDAGVSRRTKTVALEANCDLTTSGIVRTPGGGEASLSGVQRMTNEDISSLRIRVENFIGIVKKRFKVLGRVHASKDIPIMEKVIYVCFMLHNFSCPIIK
jgi:hypothetical protein